MKKQKNTLLVLITCGISILTMVGCGDDDSSGSTAVATPPPSSLDGTTLSFNPEIEFTGSSFIYNNSIQDSDLPGGTGVTGTYVETEEGDTLVIELEASGAEFNNEIIKLTLSDFYDDQNDGIIDRFTCAFEWGQATGSTQGNFLGVGPENPDFEGELQDFAGSPTEEEWASYIVGKWILNTEDGYPAENGGQIISATKIIDLESGYNSEYDIEYEERKEITYSYRKTGENTGEVNYTMIETQTYTGNNIAEYRETGLATLTFENFYKARYSVTWEETGYTFNGVPDSEFGLESGTDTGVFEFVATKPAL